MVMVVNEFQSIMPVKENKMKPTHGTLEVQGTFEEIERELAEGGLLKSWILSALQYGPAIGHKGLENCLNRLVEYVKKNPGVLEVEAPPLLSPDLFEDLMTVASRLEKDESPQMEFLAEAYQMMDLPDRKKVSKQALASRADLEIPLDRQKAYQARMMALGASEWEELVDALQANLPKEVYEATKYIEW